MKKSNQDGPASVGELIRAYQPELIVSKQHQRKSDCIQLVRNNRDSRNQTFGYTPRPFVVCNFPHRRPNDPAQAYERFNGDFLLRVLPDPTLGVPFGKDRIWPIFLSTVAVLQQSPIIRFRTASEILDLFGMQKSGHQFERLVEGFKRIFSATIIFGPREDIQQGSLFADDQGVEVPRVAFSKERFHFIDKATLWYEHKGNSRFVDNEIQLNPRFYEEIVNHPIPTDLDAVRALADSPAALDLYMWLSYRCFNLKADQTARIPLFGPRGLVHQLGSEPYARERDFRRRLDGWLRSVRMLWPSCPARIDNDGTYLQIKHAVAMHPRPPLEAAGL